MDSSQKTLLHVGCGRKRKDQTTQAFRSSAWIEVRLDVDKSVEPDVIGSMTNMAGISSASVDAIFSSHNIEHLHPHEVPVALQEFLRVLKDDGFLVLTCPDLQSICALVAEDRLTDIAYLSPAGPITPLDVLFGHRKSLALGNLYMAHNCGFTRKVLEATLRQVGFGAVATLARRGAPFFDLWALATKKVVQEEEIRALANCHFPIQVKEPLKSSHDYRT